jgi:uncharacterized protein YjbI with pentapeptide repeats
MDIKHITFDNCQLLKVDFTEAQLQGARFLACNLEGALFRDTNLSKADFSTAFNYQIRPDQNRLKGAIFSSQGLEGLLVHLGLTYV